MSDFSHGKNLDRIKKSHEGFITKCDLPSQIETFCKGWLRKICVTHTLHAKHDKFLKKLTIICMCMPPWGGLQRVGVSIVKTFLTICYLFRYLLTKRALFPLKLNLDKHYAYSHGTYLFHQVACISILLLRGGSARTRINSNPTNHHPFCFVSNSSRNLCVCVKVP